MKGAVKTKFFPLTGRQRRFSDMTASLCVRRDELWVQRGKSFDDHHTSDDSETEKRLTAHGRPQFYLSL